MNNRYAETQYDFAIALDDGQLEGHLTVPTNAPAIIIFADSDSRNSAESLRLAEAFQNHNFGTLQMDMLLEGEEDSPQMYPMLAERLATALNWLKDDADTRFSEYMLFARTPSGANNALSVMRERAKQISTIVLHVDLVNPTELPELSVPTLVLTGTIPDIKKDNLFMAKPDNVVQQVIEWYNDYPYKVQKDAE
ncbi:MAG: hypothetical protein L0154_16400 [Chloroflexi bacterium]|nr:hypothetical protein [Chloroflexota bacterium]